MELKEFMDRNGVSKDDIIMAGWLANEICKSFDCGFCPYHIHEVDGAGICANSAKRADKDSVEKMVKERVQELLHPNRMEKVAEMLGVKFNQTVLITYGNGKGSQACYLDEIGLHLSGLANHVKPELLQDLLTGKAYIEKEWNGNE